MQDLGAHARRERIFVFTACEHCRSLHDSNPYIAHINGTEHRVDYEPRVANRMFGGNLELARPYMVSGELLIELLQRYHHYFGDEVKVEFQPAQERC